MKTFKDLKIGDKLYIVNEGESFGIRIEEPTIIGITHECGDLVLEFEGGLHGWIDETQENLKKCGFYFANLKDAQEYYLKKEHEIYCSLVGKAAKYLKKYNDIVEIMNNISEERDRIETELILNGSNLEN